MEPFQVLLPHAGVREGAEPGVHPVDRCVARDRVGDHAAAGFHPVRHAGPQFGAGVPAATGASGGIDIAVGKLAVYTAAGGINPTGRCR